MNCANFTGAFLVVNTDRAVKLTQIQISKADWARPTTSKRDKLAAHACCLVTFDNQTILLSVFLFY